jgi:hypothetical protein
MIAQREDAKVLVGREKKHKEPVSVVSLFRLMTNRLARDVGYVTVTKDIVVENQYLRFLVQCLGPHYRVCLRHLLRIECFKRVSCHDTVLLKIVLSSEVTPWPGKLYKSNSVTIAAPKADTDKYIEDIILSSDY